jgi:hypothetical protein
MNDAKKLDDIFVAQVLTLACQFRQWEAETRTLKPDKSPDDFIGSAFYTMSRHRGEILSMWRPARSPD